MDLEAPPDALGIKPHGVYDFRLVKGPRCFGQGYIIGYNFLEFLQLSAEGGRILGGVL